MTYYRLLLSSVCRYPVVVKAFDPKTNLHQLSFVSLNGVEEWYDINNPRRRIRWVIPNSVPDEQMTPER